MNFAEKFKNSLKKWSGNTSLICDVSDDYIIKSISKHIEPFFVNNRVPIAFENRTTEWKEISEMTDIFVNTFLIQEIDNLSDGPNCLHGLLLLTESPIEVSLLLALILSARENTVEIVKIEGKHPDNKYPNNIQYIKGYGLHKSLLIEPQKQIGDYRVDFLLSYSGIKSWEIDENNKNNRIPLMTKNKIVIECDGHDFHEKTKEQAKKDKSRDRVLQSFGYKVYRFTGSEIFQDNMKCAEEVIKSITGSSFKDDIE